MGVLEVVAPGERTSPRDYSIWNVVLPLLALTANAAATPDYCPPLGPVFPAPTNLSSNPDFLSATNITAALQQAIALDMISSGSISLQIFSANDANSLYKFSHTDDSIKNGSVSVRNVDENTVFRVGSNSKLWTMFLFLIERGIVHFEEPIAKYIPELRTHHNSTQQKDAIDYMRWDEITIGQLATHHVGIARDYAFLDLEFEGAELQKDSFPTLPKSEEMTCGRKQFFPGLLKAHPLVPISSTPVYSNAGYQILGYALEAIAGQSYQDILADRLIKPLNLTRSSYSAPDSSLGVIPVNLNDSAWALLAGDETPAGGLYSSAKDMAAVGRAILNNTLLPPTITRRWMKPATHTSSLAFSSGDLGLYASAIALSPEHGVGSTILAAGENTSTTVTLIAQQIADILLPVLENIAKNQARQRFVGTYSLIQGTSNSSSTLTMDNGPSLKVEKWISNSVDMFETLTTLEGVTNRSFLSVRLYPTGLESPGRVSLMAVIQGLPSSVLKGPFLRSCQTWINLESLVYGNLGLMQFEFDLNEKGEVESLSPQALRISLPNV